MRFDRDFDTLHDTYINFMVLRKGTFLFVDEIFEKIDFTHIWIMKKMLLNLQSIDW